MIALWARCQGVEGTLAHLPDTGGVNDQAAYVMAAFGILDKAAADYAEWRERVRE